MKTRHVKAFGALSGASFIQLAVQVARGKLMAIVLAPAGVGVLNQLLTLSNIFSNVSSLGFFSGVVREVAKSDGEGDREAIKREISSAGIFLCTLALVLTAVGVACSGLLSDLVFDDGGQRAGFVALTLLSVPIGVAVQVYRALLSGLRHVGGIVKTRVYGDLASLAVLAGLMIPLGLKGAVLAFIGGQLITLALNIRHAIQAVGSEMAAVRFSHFSWKHVRHNVGISFVSVLIGMMTTLTVLLPSRWIIGSLGVHDNGLFVTAWRISVVYIGAIQATSHSYVFPTLAATRTDAELSEELDNALKLYMLTIPPIILGITALGDVLMTVLFTTEFAAAAILLCLLLPGDIFRIAFETMGLSFWSQKNIWRSLALKCWVLVYLGLVWVMLPKWGLLGVAGAYLIGQVIAAAAMWIAVRRRFGFRMSPGLAWALVRGAALTLGASAVIFSVGFGWTARFACGALLLVWCGLTLLDPQTRELVRKVWTHVSQRLSGRRA